VAALGVRDIIVCGHTNCGTMKALIGDLDQLADTMPLARGELNLHGWVYSLETGEVYAFRPEEGEFMPLSESKAT
jgi:carbonic anhydrase